ncbi:YegP family protein [Duganella hordei]|uniref:YegP family protein n=1 Tax=Duganella hordei TaxID=2865934 RepID=UPI0030E882FA
MWFELYEDSCPITKEPWRWRLRDNGGSVVALSTTGYCSEADCRQAVQDLQMISPKTPIQTRSRLAQDRARKSRRQTKQ